MKKILILGIVVLSIFIIYLTTIDKKVYYLSLGDQISLGMTQEGYYEKSYTEYIKEYLERNEKLAKEILLSSSRYTFKDLFLLSFKLLRCFKKAMMSGADLLNEDEITSVFDKVNFRVQYEETLEDGALTQLAHIISAP